MVTISGFNLQRNDRRSVIPNLFRDLYDLSVRQCKQSNIIKKMKNAYVYIVTNKLKGTLYIGVTSNLIKRIYEHKTNAMDGFTSTYNLKLLVYYEIFEDIENAIL